MWSVFCTASSIDQQTNNVTLFSVIEQINATRKKDAPLIDVKNGEPLPVQMELVTLWRKLGLDEKISASCDYVLISPLGKEIARQNVPIEISSISKRLRTKMQINGIRATGPGYYTWQLLVKYKGMEEILGSASFELVLDTEK